MSGSTTTLPNGDEFWMTMDIPDGEANGVLVLVITSCISAVAVLSLTSAIAISAWNTRHSSQPNLFVRSHAAGYLISLLICDLFQAVGSLMNARWYMDKAVRFEPFCITQGAIKQLSDVGTAIWVTVIACHTFWVLFLRWPLRPYIRIAVMVFVWSSIASLVIAGPATLDTKLNGPFFGISGYWCWISGEYPGSRIGLDYVFMFISTFISSVLYILVFLRLRGNILLQGSRVRFRAHHKSDESSGLSADNHTMKIAKQMLLYPLAYTAIIVPIGVVRFAEWSGHDISFAVTIFSDTIYLLSGLVNVVLFIFTRRVLPRHSIITKQFCGEASPAQITLSSVSMDATLESYGTEKMSEEVESEKVFMRVDSPDDDDGTMIPVHLFSSSNETPLSPPGLSPELTQIPLDYGDHSRDSAVFFASVLMPTYPQSPILTQDP